MGGVAQAEYAGCQVLGDAFGVLVQGILFVIVVSSLMLKWRLESPRRRIKIFLLDSSKQMVGQGAIHIMNMMCAVVFSGMDTATADECAWYWVNIMIDTTLGVLVSWALLKCTERILGYDS